MWTKYGSCNLPGREQRTTPAVFRGKRGTSRVRASLVLPKNMAEASRADIYVSDDYCCIGFHFHPAGAFKAYSPKSAATVKVNIPATYAKTIPFGTTDVELSREGEMLVLDLTQLQKPATDMAAE